MVPGMKIRWLLVALLSAALAVAAGCGDDSKDSPFEGNWISENGKEITFTSDTWSDSDGDSGTYSFTGEDPTFTLTLDNAAGRVLRRATFRNKFDMELCDLSPDNVLGACVDLVFDKPTLH
jgi:hypothetical protein